VVDSDAVDHLTYLDIGMTDLERRGSSLPRITARALCTLDMFRVSSADAEPRPMTSLSAPVDCFCLMNLSRRRTRRRGTVEW